MASKGQISGMRGVYLVAAELARLGFVVSPTSRSAKGVDLLVTNSNGTKTFAVEVKSDKRATFWLVGKTIGERSSRNNAHVFVKLSPNQDRSRFFVVPSAVISKLIVRGKTFTFIKRASIEKYEDRWQFFGLA
jgi:hypothetical protein